MENKFAKREKSAAKRVAGMKYFADTYALMEIIKGNTNYQKFLHEELFTSIFNLYELYYILLRDYNGDVAKKYFFQFKENLLRFTDEAIFGASRFKFEKARRHISYTNARGYILSLENGIKFLTVDGEFKEMKNVTFAK